MEGKEVSHAYQSLIGGVPEVLYYASELHKGEFVAESVFKRVYNALKSGSVAVGSAGKPGKVHLQCMYTLS